MKLCELIIESLGRERKSQLVRAIIDYQNGVRKKNNLPIIDPNDNFYVRMAEDTINLALQADPTRGIKRGLLEWIVFNARPADNPRWWWEWRPRDISWVLVEFEKAKTTKLWRKLMSDDFVYCDGFYDNPMVNDHHLSATNPVFELDVLKYESMKKLASAVLLYHCVINKEKERHEQDQKVVKSNSRIIYGDGRFKIVRVSNPNAARILCADSGWCVGEPPDADGDFAASYIGDGDLFLVYDGKTRYALVAFAERFLEKNSNLPVEEYLNETEVKLRGNSDPDRGEAYNLGVLFRKAGLLVSRYVRGKTREERLQRLRSIKSYLAGHSDSKEFVASLWFWAGNLNWPVPKIEVRAD